MVSTPARLSGEEAIRAGVDTMSRDHLSKQLIAEATTRREAQQMCMALRNERKKDAVKYQSLCGQLEALNGELHAAKDKALAAQVRACSARSLVRILRIRFWAWVWK